MVRLEQDLHSHFIGFICIYSAILLSFIATTQNQLYTVLHTLSLEDDWMRVYDNIRG